MISLSTENPDQDKQSNATASGSGRGEVVIFPGLDFRWISSALAYWKKTGKSYNDAPSPEAQTPAGDKNNDVP